MESAVQILAIVHFVVIGISHIVRPDVWAGFFTRLYQRGEAGVFAAAFLSLGFGSIIVAFHNVWTGLPVVLTVYGWTQVVKALIYFVWPAVGLRKLAAVSEKDARLFALPGAALLVLAALLAVHLVAGP